MENIKEINLTEIMSAIVRKLWLIVLCAVVAGAAARIYTENFITPLYRSSVSIYVNNTVTTNNTTMGISASDLATSQRLVLTYINILRSDTVLEKVAENVREKDGIQTSAGAIRGAMTAGSMGETELFEVSISTPNPHTSAAIANAIAEVAPAEIAYFVEGSSTKIVDYAKVAGGPYSPNPSQNTMLGMIGGAMIAVVIIVLQTLLDVRVKGEEDLALISSAPVLGMIPDLAMEIKDHYGYKTGYKSGYRTYTSAYKASPRKDNNEEAGE